jgi:hypothetical protein
MDSPDASVVKPTGEMFVLDSDYRGGALLLLFVSSVLFGFSVYNCVLFQKIRRKPSQSVTYDESTAMFTISIIISIFAGVAWLYAIVKLAVSSEQRSSIYKSAVAFASAPAGGIPKQGRITPTRLRQEFYIKRDDQREREQEQLQEFVPKRDVFVDEVFREGAQKYPGLVDVSGGYS